MAGGDTPRTAYTTRFGSLDDYSKGGIDVIDDKPRNYAFSNMFEVAGASKPWVKVAVGKNMEYVLEVIRAEGTSEWRSCAHDEFPLVMDGEVTIELFKPDVALVPADKHGSIRVEALPAGRPMGRMVLRRGHQALLPAGAAYRMSAGTPSVVLLQTIAGDDTVYRWAEICLR
ncbi:MAG: hydroxyquinol 1,2-dioxygenase [Ilumatobacteraceae bacterium]